MIGQIDSQANFATCSSTVAVSLERAHTIEHERIAIALKENFARLASLQVLRGKPQWLSCRHQQPLQGHDGCLSKSVQCGLETQP